MTGAVAQAAGTVARRDAPLCREAVRTLLHGHRYDGSRAERELGLAYTPMELTVRRTLGWYAERGSPRAVRAAGIGLGIGFPVRTGGFAMSDEQRPDRNLAIELVE